MNINKENFIQELEKLITSTENINNIEEFFSNLISSSIYIYGAGNAGGMTYQLLKDVNINIDGFIDRRADELKTYMAKPVFKVDDKNIKRDAFIIIAVMCGYDELEDMKNWLSKQGYDKKCFFMDIYNLVIKKGFMKVNSSKLELNKSAFNNDQHRIFEVANSLSDDRSREVFYDFFNAVMNSNAKLFSKPEIGIQYFVNDIPFVKGYSRFIDCGAFDGDTAIMLKKCKGKITKLALFEPDNNNFTKLRRTLQNERVADEEVLFPCGVWNKSEMLRFKSGIESSSAISEIGDVYVQCVALDDVLRDFAPTFIKMDIEGAEYDALLGAETMIKRYTPDLAISVYHKIEHMWDIPLIIKQFNSNYKFYLRCHDSHGMETILYATCEH